MYESFFGFNEKPFNITPDPKYLFLSEQHQEAIAHLTYGIQERGGFVVVTGEIGTGKTTLCRHLLNEMDDRTEGAIIFNPNQSEIELLKSINDDFGISSAGETKKELIDELNTFLLEERLRGKNMVIIIDEAQNLHSSVLEQVRMLSNLETEKEKLLQVILIGQPQLKKLLDRPELRQLNQRVTARYHLRPLNKNDIFQYIQHRLDVAADGHRVVFEPAAMKLIYRFSKGVPRLVNVVCDRALLAAFVSGKGSPITKKLVKQAIAEVVGPKFSTREKPILSGATVRLFVYMTALMVVAFVGWSGLATLRLLQKSNSSGPHAELIPDLPFDQGVTPDAIAHPDSIEASPAPAEKAPVATKAPPASTESPLPAVGETPPASIEKVALAKVEQPTPAPQGLASPYSEEEKQAMMDLLLSSSYRESRVNAVRNLISLWGDTPRVTLQNSGSFHDLAQVQGMRCNELWTNLNGLRLCNSACILEMFVPQELKPRYVVLMELGENNAKILFGNDTQFQEMPLHLLDEFWLRRAFVFWKDFEQAREMLKLGDSGGPVVWLQAGLKSLGMYDGGMTGTFDKKTEEAVREFQQRYNLLLDGIVGPRTRLALYANLNRYPVPRLKAQDI